MAAAFTDPALGLGEEHRQVQEVALDFAKRELAPHMSTWDETAEFPTATLCRAAALGFAGIYVDSTHGGSGLGRMEGSLIFEALSQGCVSTAAYLSIHKYAAAVASPFALLMLPVPP